MNEEKIILINLSKGGMAKKFVFSRLDIFDENQTSRNGSAQGFQVSERKDFYIYVDEFQTVVTQTFENILSEARKYGLNLTMAHQYAAKFYRKFHQAVLGNCGSIISFAWR